MRSRAPSTPRSPSTTWASESVVGAFLFGASTLGLTFYAGMLERLVGSVERNEPAQPVLVVLRTLPWGRLLLAEAILVVIGAVASLLLVIPGLIVGTLFALVGPLINLLDSLGARGLPAFAAAGVAALHAGVLLHHAAAGGRARGRGLRGRARFPTSTSGRSSSPPSSSATSSAWRSGLMEVTLAERLVTGAQGPGAGPTVGGRGAARSSPIQAATAVHGIDGTPD